MQVVLTVKNTSKVINPSKDSVILYDGHDWYVTTKDELFKEWTELIEIANGKILALEQQNNQFKHEVGTQLQEMTNLIHQLFEVKGENL